MPDPAPQRPTASAIFEPLAFRNLTVKNRILRSSTGGRWDNYDGSGTPARINWDLKIARGGVGAIISSHAPVHPRGRLLPGLRADRPGRPGPVLAGARSAACTSTTASTSCSSRTPAASG